MLKGSDVLVPLFNPRKHHWPDHFEIVDGEILPKTAIGEATVKILEFNTIERILERIELMRAGVY